ncbi:MAG TPA: pitrilysin family protein [Longimicrobiales bacterium]
MSRGGAGSLDRFTPPVPGAVRSFDFPEVSRSSLSNGLEVWSAAAPRVPLVTLSLVLPVGEAGVPQERAGALALTADALEGGTLRRSGTELAEAFERLGITFSAAAGWDGTSLSVTCLADRMERAVALLAEVAMEPAFPGDEVNRLREQSLSRIRQRLMDPSGFATDRAAALFYADEVPYARPVGGTEASVSDLTPEVLRSFWERCFRPRGAAVVAVGDLDTQALAGALEAAFGAWTGDAPSRPDFAPEPRADGRAVHVVHRPGSVQSELRIGHVGAPRDTPDYVPLAVANTVLGGSFTSRLNLNLRERNGFTYGVRSRFSFRRQAGPFTVSTAVGSDQTAPAAREVMAELETFARQGPTEEETATARDYIAGVFPLQLETTSQVAGRITEIVVYDLPEDWPTFFRDRVRSVTAQAAADAARRHIRPGSAQIVVVGDAEAVTSTLEAEGLGPVTVHDGVG